MKTTTAILVLGILGASTSCFAAELCGRLTAEALNGSEGKAYFIANDSGENSVFPESASVAKELDEDIYKDVCVTGKNTRKGFAASSVSLTEK